MCAHILVRVGAATAGEPDGRRRDEVQPDASGQRAHGAVAARLPSLHLGLTIGADCLRF